MPLRPTQSFALSWHTEPSTSCSTSPGYSTAASCSEPCKYDVRWKPKSDTLMSCFSFYFFSFLQTWSFFPFLSQLVIAALKCHKYDKSIQVTGSAALFYLTNTEYRSDQSVRLRREVIQVVLNGMEQYQEVTVSQLRGVPVTRINFSVKQ